MILAIVLAAGESRRMGRRKVLLPYGQSTVLETILDAIAASPVDGCVVVTGFEPEPVVRVLGGRDVCVAQNGDYAEGGMLSSIRAGLLAGPDAVDGVMVFTGDQPAVSPALITALLTAFRPGRGDIIVPTYGERRGHPLLFDGVYRSEVLQDFESTGLRGLHARYPERVKEVPWDGSVLLDLDTPEDYRQALARLHDAGEA